MIRQLDGIVLMLENVFQGKLNVLRTHDTSSHHGLGS